MNSEQFNQFIEKCKTSGLDLWNIQILKIAYKMNINVEQIKLLADSKLSFEQAMQLFICMLDHVDLDILHESKDKCLSSAEIINIRKEFILSQNIKSEIDPECIIEKLNEINTKVDQFIAFSNKPEVIVERNKAVHSKNQNIVKPEKKKNIFQFFKKEETMLDIIKNGEFNEEQMNELYIAYENGVPVEQIKNIANAKYPAIKIKHLRNIAELIYGKTDFKENRKESLKIEITDQNDTLLMGQVAKVITEADSQQEIASEDEIIFVPEPEEDEDEIFVAEE